MENPGLRNPRAARGSSLIELAIILTLLLMLALGVVDFARAIQFSNILVTMSREGANTASRTPANTTALQQNIITALNNTANPLEMTAHGMIYITQIKGVTTNGTVYPQVQIQTRAPAGDTSLPSQVWNNCGTWDNNNGGCTSIPSSPNNNTATFRATMPMVVDAMGNSAPLTLNDGDIVYAVETLYNYQVIVKYVMKTGPKLYSLTVL